MCMARVVITTDVCRDRSGATRKWPAAKGPAIFIAGVRGNVSVPIEQRDAYAKIGGVVVVVDDALAIALEQLHIAAQVAGQREAPGEAPGAMLLAAAAQGIAQHQAEFLSVPLMHDLHVGASHVIADVRIVVVGRLLRNAPPWTEHDGPAAALEADLSRHAIPAARKRIRLAVGLMIHAD